jgi:hypothetical protein
MTPFSGAVGLAALRFGDTVGYYFQRCSALSAEPCAGTDGCLAGRTKQLKLAPALLTKGRIGRVFAPSIRAPHRHRRKRVTKWDACITDRRVKTTSGRVKLPGFRPHTEVDLYLTPTSMTAYDSA